MPGDAYEMEPVYCIQSTRVSHDDTIVTAILRGT